MSDSWTDLKKRSWVNVIAYSPGGAVFLKCIECGSNSIIAGYLFREISDVIEMLGPQHAVQSVSDTGANYNCCGDMLIEKWSHMYRTNCVAHMINLLLKDIHKHVRWVREIIDDSKHVVDYMHRHTTVIALMREFTNDKEIKQPCKTRGFHCNRVEIALKTVRKIQYDIFWDGAKEVIVFMDPLTRILHLVDSDGSTACYLYEATVRAKEKLRKLKESDGVKYFTILDLFDTRVEKNIIHSVHVLSAALNPNNLFDGGLLIKTSTIVQGKKCIVATMVPLEDRDQFTTEIVEDLVGIYGQLSSCGSKIACRILSQPCSSSPCERNWNAWDAAQIEKRNRLTPEMLEDLIYIRMNSLMKEKYESRAIQNTKPIDLEKLGDLPDVNIELEIERLEETYVEPFHDQPNSIL
ncbi:uncharacterized protein LOC122092871 [Macadamia integrifolia]|uniref:uncharacterized protein LOC122092871 n=1 Tax=Macadamia integrifolia TaxID=60698 RepID=UPI001C52C759|nr:uncharacterized protein LOC122092871 [Macadamia integrifolia]